MWDVTENLLYIKQFEGLFSDDELVLLTAMSPSDTARMHLSDDFIQLVPY